MWKGLLATLFAISLVACTTVTTDVDKQADFSSYKTFDFGEQSDTPTSLDARRIEQGLAAQLESKGLSRVKSGGGSVRAPRHHQGVGDRIFWFKL